MAKTFSIKTLGCKLNFYESEKISKQMTASGWTRRSFGAPVDVVIVNSCAVTENSEKKCRNYLRQASRWGAVIATGCISETGRSLMADIDGIRAFVSNENKSDIPFIAETYVGHTDILSSALPSQRAHMENRDKRTRASLKVQDGCDGVCSYCLVPTLRGAPRSRDVVEILEEATDLITNGYREIVLTGITIGKYQNSGIGLAGLVEKLIGLPGNFRIRITSIEPLHLGPALAELFASSKLCRHIHLPLQSGSDAILADMNRPYSVHQYLNAVKLIRKYSPRVALGSDVIVGFPTETDAHFRETLATVKECGFAYAHIFTFSARKGTPAAVMPLKNTPSEVDERCRILRGVCDASAQLYMSSFAGSVLPCILEYNRQGRLIAISDNYLKIKIINDYTLRGQKPHDILPVKFLTFSPECTGELL